MKENRYIEKVIEYTKKYYKEDIDGIVAYGSFVRGDMHEHSDIDLFFIPSSERGFMAAFQVIIEDIGYDFFPLTWDRLIKISKFEDPLTSLILEGVMVYHRHDEVFNRFEELRKDTVHFERYESLLPGIVKELKYLYFDYPETIPDILTKCVMAVMYKNHLPLRKGMMDFEKELESVRKPHLFIENIKFLIENPTKKGIKQLIQTCESFLFEKEEEINELYPGFYEELKSLYQKGHETTSVYKQFFIKSIIEKESTSYFGPSFSFPKQNKGYDEWLNEHESKVINILSEKNVMIHEYTTLEDFLLFYLKV